MSDWNGGGVAVADQVLVVPAPHEVPGTEVGRLALVVDCMEQADDGEKRRLLAYLVDRYGQQGSTGRGGRR